MGNKATKQGDPRRVVGYARCSTAEQELSPAAQRAALERWCAAHGAELVAMHADVGVSGSKDLGARAGFVAALRDLAVYGAGVLLVSKRDRLARDVFVALTLEREVARAGARLVSADGGDAGDDPFAVFKRHLDDAYAELERAKIRERTREALAVKKSRGERVGTVAYGFRLAADRVHVLPEPREQEIMSAARELRGRGLSLRQIGAALEARGMAPRCGRRWHAVTVRALVTGSPVAVASRRCAA
jgi:DNA invertase Pin-like site-specific DNA recombinase